MGDVLIDLTGQRFGKLTAIKLSGTRKNGVLCWECVCDCGNASIHRSDALRHGGVSSCGCLRKRLDYTGKRIGKLVVQERIGGGNETMWKCLCDCGGTSIVRASRIKNREVYSCGCATNLIDLAGQRFGRLTVLERAPDPKASSKVRWKCLCDCGTTCVIVGSSLKKDDGTKSCGCLLREWRKQQQKDSGVTGLLRLLRSYKHNAKRRGLLFILSDQRFYELTQGDCFYCGEAPSQIQRGGDKDDNGDYVYNGIDRVDSAKGYEEGNVVSCCGTCNMAKNAMSRDDFLDWIARVAKHQLESGNLKLNPDWKPTKKAA